MAKWGDQERKSENSLGVLLVVGAAYVMEKLVYGALWVVLGSGEMVGKLTRRISVRNRDGK